MINRSMFSTFLLLAAALIWGTSFVAQILGMEYIGPFTFCASRYIVSFASLSAFILLLKAVKKDSSDSKKEDSWKDCLKSGVLCGVALFSASVLQQIGLQYTSAGKAAFITAMYIVIVPLFGLASRKIPSRVTIFAIMLSAAGLWLLSMKGGYTMEPGDLLVFTSAFFWAAHITACSSFSRKHDPIKISVIQFGTVAVCSTAASLAFETPKLADVAASWGPVLYAGFMCTCVPYTLQMFAQRNISPVAACVALSTEAIFAAIFGWALLGEILTSREILGCVILFSATIIAQLDEVKAEKP